MIEPFGTLPDGRTVHRITIGSGPLKARFLTFGAILQDLRYQGHAKSLTLGLSSLDEYLSYKGYFGATVGRCANRIGNAQFELDGRMFDVDPNFLGRHHLHGGSEGISDRLWSINASGSDFVTMTHTLTDGDMGYPGNLAVEAVFRVEDGALDIQYRATTDAPTLCNLAHHSYWILDDSGSILDHELYINAQDYTPVDAELIPTGDIKATDRTHLDFFEERPIRDGSLKGVIDHNYVISVGKSDWMKTAARLTSWNADLSVEVISNEPGLQVYDAGLMDLPILDIDGRALKPHAGIALEPQVWPDAINNPDFPQVVLRHGETYNQHTRFEIKKVK